MNDDWILRTGLVLFVERFEPCVAFYRDTLGLPLLRDQGDVVILGFGEGYLMIERGGAAAIEKSVAQNPTVIRFNVADVEASAAMLRERGVEVEVHSYDWGIIGRFRDPDGNACALRNHYDGFFAPLRA